MFSKPLTRDCDIYLVFLKSLEFPVMGMKTMTFVVNNKPLPTSPEFMLMMGRLEDGIWLPEKPCDYRIGSFGITC